MSRELDDFPWRRRAFVGALTTAATSLAVARPAAARARHRFSARVSFLGLDPHGSDRHDDELHAGARITIERYHATARDDLRRVELEVSGGPDGAEGFVAFAWSAGAIAGPSRPVSFVAAVYDDLEGLELTLVLEGRHRLPVRLHPAGDSRHRLRCGLYWLELVDAEDQVLGRFDFSVGPPPAP